MEKKVDIAIIGAGTAGISAFKEVMKTTKNAALINSGPHGTTCARIGLAITFSEPNIAIVGKNYNSLKNEEIIIGESSFETQSRSLIMGKNKGLL